MVRGPEGAVVQQAPCHAPFGAPRMAFWLGSRYWCMALRNTGKPIQSSKNTHGNNRSHTKPQKTTTTQRTTQRGSSSPPNGAQQRMKRAPYPAPQQRTNDAAEALATEAHTKQQKLTRSSRSTNEEAEVHAEATKAQTKQQKPI